MKTEGFLFDGDLLKHLQNNLALVNSDLEELYKNGFDIKVRIEDKIIMGRLNPLPTIEIEVLRDFMKLIKSIEMPF